MVVSHDTMCHSDSYPGMREQNPDWVLHHLSDAVLPALRQQGVDEPQTDQMLVTNPRRLFERQHG